jgi:hypothetical protein
MSNFTNTYIKNLKPRPNKQYEEYEGQGFGIKVSPAPCVRIDVASN